MPDMVHYSAIFTLPDGEHHMHGWAESMSTARKHVDENILGRRRVKFPKEPAVLKSIRQISPADVDKVAAEEDARIRALYPNRVHVTDIFDEPNRILEESVTPEAEAEEATSDDPANPAGL